MLDAELKAVRQAVEEVLRAESFPLRILPESVREAVLAYPLRPGKSLRPALLTWTCELAGGAADRARRAAAAVELYHNWTLIHDDIIDRDDQRRGGPSCHRLLERTAPATVAESAKGTYGRAQAMLAGDILHAWSVDLLLRAVEDGVPTAVAHAVARRMCGELTPRLISGEALDVQFEAQGAAAADDLLAMLRLKTALLLRFAAETGAMLGSASADANHPLVRTAGAFAESAGLAFQIQDDILGLFAREEDLGKPVGSDVRAGKPTLLYAEALRRADPDQQTLLRQAFGNADVSGETLEKVRKIVLATGARDAVAKRAGTFMSDARSHLESLPGTPARDKLAAWADCILDRTR